MSCFEAFSGIRNLTVSVVRVLEEIWDETKDELRMMARLGLFLPVFLTAGDFNKVAYRYRELSKC